MQLIIIVDINWIIELSEKTVLDEASRCKTEDDDTEDEEDGLPEDVVDGIDLY